MGAVVVLGAIWEIVYLCLVVLGESVTVCRSRSPAGTAPSGASRWLSSDGWRILVTSDDEGTRLDERLVTRVTQEGPHMTGLVLIYEVAGDVDADHGYLFPGRFLR
jgi:hypothetical protein